MQQKQVEYNEFRDWVMEVWARNIPEQRELRYGQSFCEHFGITDPELYYMQEYSEAAQIIRTNYIKY